MANAGLASAIAPAHKICASVMNLGLAWIVSLRPYNASEVALDRKRVSRAQRGPIAWTHPLLGKPAHYQGRPKIKLNVELGSSVRLNHDNGSPSGNDHV
ncbi:hypothetical protein FRC02_010845 [Tulasnella sp. 418]|nr:hypothetical protein FRC02_010845 [Tulasnella sp. 418]